MEDENRTDSSHPLAFEASVACMPTSDSCREEESLTYQNQSVSPIPCRKSEGQASEAENPDKEEDVLIEDDVSDLESCGSTLEHGEVPVVKNNEQDGVETSSVCEANCIIIVIYS